VLNCLLNMVSHGQQLGSSILVCGMSCCTCRDLPLGALSMTESYINAPPPCARSPQELQAAIDKALRLLGAPAPAGAAQ
jgi:hypothetical protein